MSSTLKIIDLRTIEDREEATSFAESIIVKGVVNWEHPMWQEWEAINKEVLSTMGNQMLLVYTTLFPQWLLLSVAKGYETARQATIDF